MTLSQEADHTSRIQAMFARISKRYNLMNALMTLGQDQTWRRHVVSMAALPKGGRLLDVGTGTGDIALEALRQESTLEVTAVDVTPAMMHVGRRRRGGHSVRWCCGDALYLPFPDATFEAVTSGYLVRNVFDVRRAFREQLRVVKPGGRVVCLDTSPSSRRVLRPLVLVYLKVLIPLLGCLVARDIQAYTYLPDSTQAFLTRAQLISVMESAGFQDVRHRQFMLATQVACVGIRPEEHLP